MRSVLIACVLACALLLVGRAVAQDPNSLPVFTGQIAYVGTDFNVYTVNGADSSRATLTDDAGSNGTRLLAYQWPTWSTDGRLAYFGLSVERETREPSTVVYVAPDGVTRGEQVYDGETQVYNYGYWSPQDCADGDNCRDLAVLLSDPSADGLLVERIRVDGETSSETLGTGAPFYFSWSPDGTRMLWQRNNRSLEIYDVGSAEVITTLEQLPGRVSAPAWSPVDDRLLVGALSANGNTTDLTIIGNETTQTLATGLVGPVAYAWSPDGNRIAYTADRGALMVLDTVSGDVVSRSPVAGILAFFWAPNSQQVAYVTLAATPGSFSASTGGHVAALAQGNTGLAWSVMDVETGANRRLSTFMPTGDMVYLLTYFDQFAQSHRLWSPDSRHLVYGEITPDNTSVVTILGVANSESVPLTIAEGQIGVWSFD
jgi:TolB protein